MTGILCRGRKRRHTPIVSEAQRRLFGAELGRIERGEGGRLGISKALLRLHLREVKGKDLPERVRKRK